MQWAPRINITARTGWHVDRLVPALDAALEGWETRVGTGELNAFLGRLVAEHPHPVRGGKQPKVLFGTQPTHRAADVRAVHVSGKLDAAYERYIERRLREEFGFVGHADPPDPDGRGRSGSADAQRDRVRRPASPCAVWLTTPTVSVQGELHRVAGLVRRRWRRGAADEVLTAMPSTAVIVSPARQPGAGGRGAVVGALATVLTCRPGRRPGTPGGRRRSGCW